MGWWDTVVDSVSSGVGWVADNAGDIMTAYSTISGLLGAASDLDDDPGADLVPKLYHFLGKNDAALLAACTNLVPDVGESEGDDSVTQTNIMIQGIIPDTVDTDAGDPPASLSADINKAFALNGCPTIIYAGQATGDVGSLIGEEMGTGVPPTQGPQIYETPKISLAPNANGYSVWGYHVYYPIKVNGQANAKTIWHSCLRLVAVVPQQEREEWNRRQKLLAVKNPRKSTSLGSPDDLTPKNSTTVKAFWPNGSSGVSPDRDTAMAAAITSLQSQYGLSWQIQGGPIIPGQSYGYQIFTQLDFGPVAVLQAFQTAIKTALGTANGDMPATKISQQGTVMV